MLQHLYIRHFLFIELLEIDFHERFCVVTGETGAGKSILLDALLFCFGAKQSQEVVQKGAKGCSVALVFRSTPSVKQCLLELGLASEEEDTFFLQRTRTQTGRNQSFLNNQPIASKALERLFPLCLEVQGQHGHTALANAALHASFLDAYGQLGGLQKEVACLYRAYRNIEREQARLVRERATRERDQDYLTYVCRELEQAAVLPQEEALLAEKIEELKRKESERQRALELASELRSSSIQTVIERFQRAARKAPPHPAFEAIAGHLAEAYEHIAQVQDALQMLQQGFEVVDAGIEGAEERLCTLRALARKHACSTDDLPERLEGYRQQLHRLAEQDAAQESAAEALLHAKEAYLTAATELSASREKAAENLAARTQEVLLALQLPKVAFSIAVERNPACITETGIDRVRFLVATNPGTPLAPMDKIASGGELSRFMLGLRTVLAREFEPKVLVFDEIDAGTSGSVADAIGAHLRALSQESQVIAITHQPQVAGKADQHILVEKQQYDAHTTVGVRPLAADERPTELARMISGKAITAAGLQAAKELLTAS